MTCRSPVESTRSAPGSGFSACRTMKTPPRASLGRPPSPASPPSCREPSAASRWFPTPTKLGWRSLFGAWYLQDAIKLRRNLTIRAGIRQEFTTGWNEAVRARRQLHHRRHRRPRRPRRGWAIRCSPRTTPPSCSAPASAWPGIPFGDGKTAVRAGFGTYYSLIDDLSFLLNSLPPYNGSLTASGSLFSITPVVPGAAVPPSCGPGVPAPCTTYAPAGSAGQCQDSHGAGVEPLGGAATHPGSTALRVAYVGSFGYHGLLSIDPNDIPAQICAVGSRMHGGRRCHQRNSGHRGEQSHVAQGARVHPRGHAAQSLPGRRLLLVHRGQQQLQRAADRSARTASAAALKFAPITPGRKIWT